MSNHFTIPCKCRDLMLILLWLTLLLLFPKPLIYQVHKCKICPYYHVFKLKTIPWILCMPEHLKHFASNDKFSGSFLDVKYSKPLSWDQYICVDLTNSCCVVIDSRLDKWQRQVDKFKYQVLWSKLYMKSVWV